MRGRPGDILIQQQRRSNAQLNIRGLRVNGAYFILGIRSFADDNVLFSINLIKEFLLLRER